MADDIADSDSHSPEEKIKRLGELEILLSTDKLPQEEDKKNMIIALRDTVVRKNLGNTELLNLLKAFKQDSLINRYKSFDELLEYSKYSANPVGRLILKLSDYQERNNSGMYILSDNICTGLQLINFWQDVKRDVEMNRIYIPEEIMIKYSYTHEDLYNRHYDERYKNILYELITKTEKIFKKGSSLADLLKGKLKYEFKAIYNGGNEILGKIKAIEFNTLNKRVKLHSKDKLKILYKSLIFKLD